MSSKAYIVGFGAPSLAEAFKVASGMCVDLDAAAASRMKKESPAPKSFEPENTPTGQILTENVSISGECVRAALFFKLNNLVNGKSKCRLSVAEAICTLLNNDAMPKIPLYKTDKECLRIVADAMHGVGCSMGDGKTIQSVFVQEGMDVPKLSGDERLIIEDGQSMSAGIGSVCIEGGKAVLMLSTLIAALSAEALKAEVGLTWVFLQRDVSCIVACMGKHCHYFVCLCLQVKCFDTEIADTFPLKNSVEVSETLKSMFDGSNQVNLKKNNNVIRCVTEIPAVHGMCKMEMEAAAAPIKASLSAAALPPHKSGTHGHYYSPAIAQALLSLGSSLLKCSFLSIERAKHMLDLVESSEYKQARDDLGQMVDSLKSEFEHAQQKLKTGLGDLATSEYNDTIPSVEGANATFSALEILAKISSCEALTALLLINCNSALQDKDASSDSKKGKKGGFSLGKGTEAFIGNLLGQLKNLTSDEVEHLNALNLNDVPSIFSDSKRTLKALQSMLFPSSVGGMVIIENVMKVLEANSVRRKPKIAKGARDFGPEQMAIREVVFKKITDVFKRHGAVSIDTPVFELRETLMGKYGEDSKLIYDLADQGGEMLSLRYDLTVPFARHVALHGISNIKRYHIAKVYRRDQPQMSRGRFREFFQCDFDIAGSYSTMVPDSEVLKVLVEILDDLDLGDYEIKINHRRLLDAMLDIAGVPPQKFRPICSAIDKLDKEPWEAVKEEMVIEKGLEESVADKIGEFVVLKGKPRELLTKLMDSSHPLANHPDSAAALEEMSLLFDFLDVMGAITPFSFDLSLARGLDYYTGVIYEAVFKGGNVGSIAAGGRYDFLVGMFSGKQVPAVGVSIGIERVFAIMESQMKTRADEKGGTIRETETEVLVASIGSGLQPQRMKIASELWRAGIKSEFGFKPNPKMGDQLNYALKTGIPLVIIFGEDEINSGMVKLKDLDAETEADIPENDIVQEVKNKLNKFGDRRIVYKSA